VLRFSILVWVSGSKVNTDGILRGEK